MNNRDKVVRYMKRKNEALDGELYTSDDLDEIYGWDDETIDRVYKALGMLTAYNRDDVSLCPNCVKAEGYYTLDLYCDNCVYCEYGSRHGICNQSDSTYQNMLSAAKCFGHESISEYIRSKGHNFHDMLEVDEYEHCELGSLMDLIYGGEPTNEDEELYDMLKRKDLKKVTDC